MPWRKEREQTGAEKAPSAASGVHSTWGFTRFPSPRSPHWPTLQLLPQLRKAQLPDTHSSSTWVSPDTPSPTLPCARHRQEAHSA